MLPRKCYTFVESRVFSNYNNRSPFFYLRDFEVLTLCAGKSAPTYIYKYIPKSFRREFRFRKVIMQSMRLNISPLTYPRHKQTLRFDNLMTHFLIHTYKRLKTLLSPPHFYHLVKHLFSTSRHPPPSSLTNSSMTQNNPNIICVNTHATRSTLVLLYIRIPKQIARGRNLYIAQPIRRTVALSRVYLHTRPTSNLYPIPLYFPLTRL